MLNDPVLLNDWHVMAYAPTIQEGKPVGVRLLDEDIVLWMLSLALWFCSWKVA